MRKAFIDDSNWIGGELGNEGPVRKNIYHLVNAMLISLVKLYSEHTLTTASLYHKEYRPHAWKFKSYSKEIREIQSLSDINPFLRMESIKLPQDVKLFSENEGIDIDSPYCSAKITILPHWMLITEKNDRKVHKIIIRNRNLINKDVRLLKIPICIKLEIKHNKIFSEKLENYYIWFHGLMLDAIRWLSWEEYEKGELERLVVDIYQQLNELKKNPNDV